MGVSEVEVAAKEAEVAFLRSLIHPEAMDGRTEWYCGCVFRRPLALFGGVEALSC